MFEEKDLKLYESFKKLVLEADFELKGEAVQSAAYLLHWFNGIEDKIKKSIPKPEPKPNPIKRSKRKKVSGDKP